MAEHAGNRPRNGQIGRRLPTLRATRRGAGNLDINGIIIACAVLKDGIRVLTQEEFLYAIGRARKAKGGHGSSVDNQIPFLTAKNLEPFISNELRESTTPIIFRNMRGLRAYGYRAEILPEICKVYLAAREAGVLTLTQQHIAKRCEILIQGFATVGIIALIDEATGYQDVRSRGLIRLFVQNGFLHKRVWETRTFCAKPHAGRHAQVCNYVMDDVLKTKALFEQIVVTGVILRGDGQLIRLRNPLDVVEG